MKQWSETLPEQCPPEKAFEPNGHVFYRLTKTLFPTTDDFKSQRADCPTCQFNGVSECVTRSLSVWDDINKCLNLLKLPRHKGKTTMIIELAPNDGLILQTFKPNHYSWWRTETFDITSVSTSK